MTIWMYRAEGHRVLYSFMSQNYHVIQVYRDMGKEHIGIEIG